MLRAIATPAWRKKAGRQATCQVPVVKETPTPRPRFFSASSPFRDVTRSTLLPLSQKVKLELPETFLRRGMVPMDRFNCNSQADVRIRSWGRGVFACSLPMLTAGALRRKKCCWDS